MTSSGSRRNAYLVGLERYADTTSSNNAGRLAELLQTKCRFKVEQGPATDDHLCDIFNWLDRSMRELRGQSEALLLLYYSGRAYRCKGQTFLVPRAYPLVQLPDDGAKRVPLSELLQRAHAAQGMNPSKEGVLPKLFLLVVLDCPRERADLGSAAQPHRPPCAHAASSSDVNPDVEVCIIHSMADDEDEQLGVFMGAFCEALEQPGLRWHAFWERCRAKVIAESNQQQYPWKFDSTEQMDELVFHYESAPLGDGRNANVGDECHGRDVLNVATCMSLRALEELHVDTCWAGICESKISSAIRAGRQYAEDHAEIGLAKWKFPRQSRWHEWGPRCYLALFDRNESRWVCFDQRGRSTRYIVELEIPKTSAPDFELPAGVQAQASLDARRLMGNMLKLTTRVYGKKAGQVDDNCSTIYGPGESLADDDCSTGPGESLVDKSEFGKDLRRHRCKRFGMCVPCPHWYRGDCRRERNCNFCHIDPPEVLVKIALQYFYNLAWNLATTPAQKTILRALDIVREEIEIVEAEGPRQKRRRQVLQPDCGVLPQEPKRIEAEALAHELERLEEEQRAAEQVVHHHNRTEKALKEKEASVKKAAEVPKKLAFQFIKIEDIKIEEIEEGEQDGDLRREREEVEAKEQKRRQDLETRLVAGTEDVLDEPENFIEFYRNLQGQHEDVRSVPPGLHPRIWRSRCVRALHVRVTRKLQRRPIAMGQWLNFTGMSLEEMIAVWNPVPVQNDEVEYSSYRETAEMLLADPARAVLLQELEERHLRVLEEVRDGTESSSYQNAREELVHIGELILEVNRFVHLPEEKEFWQSPGGRELHAALLDKLTQCQGLHIIEEWMAVVEAAKRSLHGAINPMNQK